MGFIQFSQGLKKKKVNRSLPSNKQSHYFHCLFKEGNYITKQPGTSNLKCSPYKFGLLKKIIILLWRNVIKCSELAAALISACLTILILYERLTFTSPQNENGFIFQKTEVMFEIIKGKLALVGSSHFKF